VNPTHRAYTPPIPGILNLDGQVRNCLKTIVKVRFERLSPEARAQLLNTEANRKVHEEFKNMYGVALFAHIYGSTTAVMSFFQCNCNLRWEYLLSIPTK
jgi:hypothetical protein